MLEISKSNFDRQDIENKVTSLKIIQNRFAAKALARWMVGFLILLFVCMFLPWQQNIEGSGSVTAFSPADRPQEVQTAIAGRIREWRVQEGQFVNKGDTLVVIEEIKSEYFDPEQLIRIEEQVDAKRKGIKASEQKIGSLQSLITAQYQGLEVSLQKARNYVLQTAFQLTIDSADYQAQLVNEQIAKRQFASYDTLFKVEGDNEIPLISRTDWEKRKQKLQEAKAKTISKLNKYDATKNKLINARIELNSLEAEYGAKIAKGESDLNSSVSSLAQKEGELSKLRNYKSNIEIRQQQYYIKAPQNGYIVKALKSGVGETLKETDAICTIQPSNPRQAVELYVAAMDVPLIEKNRMVRLEFDGWPALQFTGWPSVAVGTFGGRVTVIDYVNSKDGRYRVLVTPDKDEPWPEQLRVGSGVYGWVMLDDVPLWYEFWRQLNGFPPSIL